jgi:hypothetical protein
MLHAATGAVAAHGALARLVAADGGGPLAPRDAHHEARAKQLIFVFLTGGFSHVDTFDPKPRLGADAGKLVASTSLRPEQDVPKPLLASPFSFSPRGESGLEISSLFPSLGDMADDLCVIRSMHTDIVEHFQAVLAMHTGSATVPMPSLGAWLSYGLGTYNPNLPSYIVISEHMPYAGSQVWDSNFLPPTHQGVRIVPGSEPIANLTPATRTSSLRELEDRLRDDTNARHAAARGNDAALRARADSFRIARGMMSEAPAAFEIRGEHPATHALYGSSPGDPGSFGAQCLTARRLIERGVRVVELIDSGSHDNWDAHADMQAHAPKAARVDRALAALLIDLKRRGLLEQTLVAICTEFGRTPWTEALSTKGRNHYAKAFSCLLAGGGVRGGIAYGKTDDYGAAIVENPVHVHDYHATILHLMGIDHTRLTYRYAGRDFRLTDVDGHVLDAILA